MWRGPGEADEPALREKLTAQFLCPDGPGSSSPLHDELKAALPRTSGSEALRSGSGRHSEEGLSAVELDDLFVVACGLLETQCLPSFGASAEHDELAKKESERTHWTEATLLQAHPQPTSTAPIPSGARMFTLTARLGW